MHTSKETPKLYTMDPRPWNFPSLEIDPSYCIVCWSDDGFANVDIVEPNRADAAHSQRLLPRLL